jgi:hypothetical protein
MQNNDIYYVIAPISGLHLDFDYRMYSAEVYGCPPNYSPNPNSCLEFRQPYEYIGSLKFSEYELFAQEWKIDDESLQNLSTFQNKKLRDFTCIAFEINLDLQNYAHTPNEAISSALFQHIVDIGERILDVWRLCLFKPGEDFSIGHFGAISDGVQAFWIGQNGMIPQFIARKALRYQLIQNPVDVLLSDFGPIYTDITFRSLSVSVFSYPQNSEIINNIFDALYAFRESRDIISWEARFRHLTAIAESLAKQNRTERLRGNDLRERIAKISAQGWELYKNYGSSALTPSGLQNHQYRLIRQRYDEIGWEDENEAKEVIKDLWDNVRNPLAHTIDTVKSLNRDFVKDMINIERVIITMINGIFAAYEVEEFYPGTTIYDILLENF